MEWKYHHYTTQIRRTYRKQHENFVVTSLVHDSRLSELAPYTQHYVKRSDQGYALIDLYYPQLDLAIEIDEPYHDAATEADALRERVVAENLNCEFIRISVSTGDVLEQIEALKLHIIARKLERKEHLTLWEPPKSIDFMELRKRHENTLFVKIVGHVKPEELHKRQTGSWSLADWKRKKLDKVLIVHDNIVTRGFTKLQWERPTGDERKWRYDGTETFDIPSVGHRVNGWTWQNGRAYSLDLA